MKPHIPYIAVVEWTNKPAMNKHLLPRPTAANLLLQDWDRRNSDQSKSFSLILFGTSKNFRNVCHRSRVTAVQLLNSSRISFPAAAAFFKGRDIVYDPKGGGGPIFLPTCDSQQSLSAIVYFLKKSKFVQRLTKMSTTYCTSSERTVKPKDSVCWPQHSFRKTAGF